MLIFDVVKDTCQLVEGDNEGTFLQKISHALLDQLIECSIFIRDYAQKGRASRHAIIQVRDNARHERKEGKYARAKTSQKKMGGL